MAEGYFDGFIADAILEAADVNDYLMKQACMVFDASVSPAKTAAENRTTALSGVLREGMISYLKDVNQFEVYDNSNWIRMGKYTEFTAAVGDDALTAHYMEVL
tara:strand:+ start:1481 stop:1789 length:309 start_codon:yes stop_codon:yes gene_type:complete